MALLMGGCNDDRKRVQADVFFCNPASRSASYDCGDGYVCYTATQALGDSICVPRCDPDNEAKTCPGGRCTRAGECLTTCRVEDGDKACPAGNHATTCVRTTYSPIESASGTNGVCLPIAFSCANSDDCLGSPVFNLCTSETNGQDSDATLLRSGSVCAQGNCSRDGVACEPGSTCIKGVFGAGSQGVPDVCTPNCVYETDPHDMGVFQCTVGFTCMNTVFPQTSARVCMPGYPGWRCNESLGCVAGACEKWTNLGKPFDELAVCAPQCNDDSDCRLYDRSLPGMPANPTHFSRFICVKNRCHNMGGLFLTDACIEGSKTCNLDPEATCITGVGPNVDGATCVHRCTRDEDCDQLSETSHVRHACDPAYGMCLPSLPFVTGCTSDHGCMDGLTCYQNPTTGAKTCTANCNSDADCAAHDIMGSSFFCPEHVCVPKVVAGSPAPSPAACLSGQANAAGICQSPSGWSCDADNECASGSCAGQRCQ